MPIQTLTDIYQTTCDIPRPVVMKYKKGDRWMDVSLEEFRDTVRWFSTGLRLLGMKPGDRFGILSENRPEWTFTDLATLCAAGVSVPIYPTLLGWQIEYILNDSGCVGVVASTDEQLHKLLEIRSHIPSLNNIIVCDPPNVTLPPGVLTFEQVVQSGKEEERKSGRARFDELRNSRKPDDLATLVYTSGTTGNPKGAMLTHGNIASNVDSVTQVLPIQRGWMAMSILPLSHILERTADYAYLTFGATIAYAESVVKVGENLQEVHPDVFAAVPRLFEKMRARIMDNVATQPESKQKIFKWALKVAEERLLYRVENRAMPLGMKMRSTIADKLVFK